MSNVLVFVEHSGGKPKKASLAALTCAKQIAEKTGGELHLAVVGRDVKAAAEEVAGYGAAKVHLVDGEPFANYLVESYATAMVALVKAASATVLAAATSSTSKDLLPRVAARLDAAMASDIGAVIDGSTFKRQMWAGNVIATVELTTPMKVCTVRSTDFDPAEKEGSTSPISSLDVAVDLSSLKARFVGLQEVKSERPDVTVADVVVAGGRGAKGSDGFGLLYELADLLSAGVGASRAACDAGWVPNDFQIGQTGKIVAPNLYIGAGISGAIQHLAGMKDSKVIVAINKDPEAPIFQVADYGLVADLFQALPELIESIEKLRAS